MTTSHTDWDLLSSYAGLLTLATASIYTGSHGSVTVRKARSAKERAVEPDEDEDEEIPDRLSSGDAYLFPIIGSAVLFGLYLFLKYYGPEWINWLLQWYFTLTGIGSVGKSLISLARWTVGSHRWKQFERIQILILKGPREFVSFSMRTPSWFLLPIGALPSILYSFGPSDVRRSALLTDILALSFSHNALSLLKIDSFKTGCVLLSGLFLYDIWWVFGTEVMVKVATTLDVPIKILWPKSLTFSAARGFTMLGLGDIVIPGLFIALALRYDYDRWSQTAQATSVKKTYFHATVFAYVSGLGTTMFVMHFFKKAQPALLYLSPACMVSFFLTAFVRGELSHAWAWSDEPEKDAAADSTAAKKETLEPISASATVESTNGEPTWSSTSEVPPQSGLTAGEEDNKERTKRQKKKKN